MKTSTPEQLISCTLCGAGSGADRGSGFTRRGLRAHTCDRGKSGAKKTPLTKPEWQEMVDAPLRFPKPSPAKEAPPAPVTALVVSPRRTKAITLADLDVLPAMPVRHPLLSEMSPDQLGTMARGLDAARAQYESLSGTCATLAGLVCIEVKQRLAHGEYLPWLKTHLGKSAKTAAQYAAVAKAFLKFYPRVKFAQLTLALMDGAQSIERESLDLTHPTVSAVAQWTEGRTFYELRQEFAARPGGKTYERENGKGARKEITPEEATALLKAMCENGARHLAAIHGDQAYIVLTDAELDGIVDHCETVLADVKRWRALSKAERKQTLGAQLAKQLEAGK